MVGRMGIFAGVAVAALATFLFANIIGISVAAAQTAVADHVERLSAACGVNSDEREQLLVDFLKWNQNQEPRRGGCARQEQ